LYHEKKYENMQLVTPANLYCNIILTENIYNVPNIQTLIMTVSIQFQSTTTYEAHQEFITSTCSSHQNA
ncbi:hypothetical protein L9F63_006460, partial [Diploptera punctata]